MRLWVPVSTIVALSLVLPACNKPEPPKETPRAEPAKATPERSPSAAKGSPQKTFGAPITETKSVALDVLLKEPNKFASGTVRTEGVVTAVCKSMGCWMEIGDANGKAHIKMAGHSFFVPKDAAGHRAAVQGKVIPASASNDECAAEAKRDTGAVAKIELEATGVEFLD